MSDAITPELIALQRAALRATRDLYAYTGDDPAERHRLRQAERRLALALAAKRAEAKVHWRALLDAANEPDETGQG